jgi:N-acetyl-anhydromuramyl-L-alanine amidase AmpD
MFSQSVEGVEARLPAGREIGRSSADAAVSSYASRVTVLLGSSGRKRRPTRRRAAVPLALATALLLAAPAVAATSGGAGTDTASSSLSGHDLGDAFGAAAREFGVPRDLLVAIAWTESHLDDRGGAPSVDGGYGLMHLVDNPTDDTLARARALLGVRGSELRSDPSQNIRGGAALLRDAADHLGLRARERRDLDAWFPVVARYSNATDERVARMYAAQVYGLLSSGIQATTPDGERLVVRPHRVRVQAGPDARSLTQRASAPDYPGAIWAPAYSGNYSNYSRGRGDIKYIVIHTTQGSYAGSISWFQNPASNVSAHYVIRSSDGQVTQTVRDEDVAWHAGNWSYNLQSIGIEHEGYVAQSGWYTGAMYRSSARLVRYLAAKYDIPLDRQHILGHVDVPKATHTDPGPNWDWKRYMRLVRKDTTPAPATWSAVVDNADAQFTAGPAWGTSTWSSSRYGSDYRYAEPSPDTGDTAWYGFAVPEDGTYRVSLRYPSNAGYNAQTRVKVRTTDGRKFYTVDQRQNDGTWVDLGDVSLAAGDRRVVGISTRSSAPGYVIADAVRLSQVG